MPAGSVGSLRIASTPAPSEKITLRFGRLFTTLGGGSQQAVYSTSARFPMWLGQTRTSSDGATFAMAAAQISIGQFGQIKRNANLLPHHAFWRRLEVQRRGDQGSGVIGLGI